MAFNENPDLITTDSSWYNAQTTVQLMNLLIDKARESTSDLNDKMSGLATSLDSIRPLSTPSDSITYEAPSVGPFLGANTTFTVPTYTSPDYTAPVALASPTQVQPSPFVPNPTISVPAIMAGAASAVYIDADAEVAEPPFDIPTAIGGVNSSEFDALYKRGMENIVDQAADYWSTYFPESQSTATEIHDWALRMMADINTDVLYARDRDRIEREYQKALSESENIWASRGFAMPQGALVGIQTNLRHAADEKIAEAARSMAAKEIELMFEKATVAAKILADSRVSAISASIQYISAVVGGFGVANQQAGVFYDKQVGLVSAASDYYKAHLSLEDLKIRATQIDAELGTKVNLSNSENSVRVAIANAENQSRAAISAADSAVKIGVSSAESVTRSNIASAENATRVAVSNSESAVRVGVASMEASSRAHVAAIDAQSRVAVAQASVDERLAIANISETTRVTLSNAENQLRAAIASAELAEKGNLRVSGENIEVAKIKATASLDAIKTLATVGASALNALHAGANISAQSSGSSSTQYSENVSL